MSGHRPARAVAKPPDVKQSGQVLTFFALALPVVLLPVAAYAVDATMIASREAGLQAATAEAAEAAAQQLDVSAIRSSGALTLNAEAAMLVVRQILGGEEPGASVDTSAVSGVDLTIVTSEQVTLPFSVFARSAVLHARATARLVGGYDRPS
jgi:Flp pilus assembly protein TadG